RFAGAVGDVWDGEARRRRPLTGSLSLFYLSCPVGRVLRSFPTRRSSDLQGARDLLGLQLAEERRCGIRIRPMPPRGGGLGVEVRSEEHTSELQSRFDLVCRLLLEKKKNDHGTAALDAFNSIRVQPYSRAR